MGIDGFVSPAGMADPWPYLETLAERVIPHINGGETTARKGAA